MENSAGGEAGGFPGRWFSLGKNTSPREIREQVLETTFLVFWGRSGVAFGSLLGAFWTPWGHFGPPWAALGELGGDLGAIWAHLLGGFGIP